MARGVSSTFTSERVRTDDNAFAGLAAPPVADPGGTPAASIDDVKVTEGNSGTQNLTFTVTLSAAPAAGTSVRIPWSTADGTATAGSDYLAASGVLTFAAGVTQQQVVVTLNSDTVVESDESFTLNLGAGSGYTLDKATGTATITDDDARPSASARPRPRAAPGSEGVPVTVTLSARTRTR